MNAMRVLVYGLGQSGVAACRLLHRQGHEVLYFDHKPAPFETVEVEALGCRVSADPAAAAVDICIAAPGVPWEHPDLLALRERGIETIGEVEWVYRTVDAEIVGVTGTAGKTTVTRWISDTLQGAGLKARAGGNISPALAAVAEPGEVLVVELSSFQLERCPTLKPRVAVLLNLGQDHLDRHGTLENYHAAKRALLANLDETDTLVYNDDEPTLRRWAAASSAERKGFSLQHEAAAHLEGDILMLHGAPLLSVRELRVGGKHQQANALAVALACASLGLDEEALRRGLIRFEGVPGRYSPVGTVEGVRFVEDSIATRTLSVRAALEATPAPIVWIGGGVDKGASLTELEGLVKDKVTLFIGVGASGPAFAEALGAWTEVSLCPQSSGEEALRCACRKGLVHLQNRSGGTVLLAPLAASFDQFRDYRERAETFRRVVARLESPWIAS